MRSYKLKRSLGRSLTALIVTTLAFAGLSLTPVLGTPQAAAATNYSGFSKAVAQQVGQVTVGMSLADRAGFSNLVSMVQAKIKQGLSPIDRQRVTEALTAQGVPTTRIAAELSNPVLLAMLPLAPQPETASGARRIDESTITTSTAHKASKVDGPPAPVYKGSTSPDMDSVWPDVAGARIIEVKYIKNWAWNRTDITSAPRYEPPVINFTKWCIGCKVDLTWHDEYWYPYNGGSSHSGYANKLQFTISQCFNVWFFNQCMAPKNINWSLRLHNDGTYSAYYN